MTTHSAQEMAPGNGQQKAALNHLTAWLRDEIQFQGERVGTLATLRETLAKKDPSECEEILERVHAQEARGRSSEKRRLSIFKALGLQWNVSPTLLSLRSIAERAGDDGVRILEMRSQLAEKLQQVQSEGQMVSATARIHRGIILEVLNGLFDQKVGDPLEQQGRILDAEA